jgi:hypothetical protein
LVGEILTKEEKLKREKKKEERRKKAESLLDDIPMNDEQMKESMIEEWTTYAE